MQTFLSIYASMIFLLAPPGLSVEGKDCSNGLHGYYDNGIVYLCPADFDDTYIRMHETGHHIWFVYMTEEQRKKWSTLPGSVTEYAKTNTKEDFAETFATYMTQRKLGVAEKYRFIRKLKFQ